MKPGAVFFMGVYGGRSGEGVWDEDWDQPKRFFSFYSDDEIQEAVQEVFRIVSFQRTVLEGSLDFQALMLEKA